MGRVINYEGRRIVLPDDATDEEVAHALGGTPAPGPQSDSVLAAGGQGLARGATAGLLGMPADIVEGLRNVGLWGGDMASRALGYGPRPQRVHGSLGTSSAIADAGAPLIEKATGIKFLEPGQMTTPQRFAYSAGNAAGTAATAGGVSALAAPAAGLPMLSSYAQAPARTIIADTAGGAAGGAAGEAVNQALPDDSLMKGPLSLLASLLGGGLGREVTASAINAPGNAATAINNSRLDPALAESNVTRGAANKVAGFLQDQAGGPQAAGQAADQIESGFHAARDALAPPPLSATLTDNPGLWSVLKGQLSGPDSAPLMQRKGAISNWATQEMRDAAPANADPMMLRQAAENMFQQAQAPLISELGPLRGTAGQTSEAMHGVVAPFIRGLQEQRTQLWDPQTLAPGNPSLKTDLMSASAGRTLSQIDRMPAGYGQQLAPVNRLMELYGLRQNLEPTPRPTTGPEALLPRMDTVTNTGGPGMLPAQDIAQIRREAAKSASGAARNDDYTMAASHRGVADAAAAALRQNPEIAANLDRAMSFEKNTYQPTLERGPASPTTGLAESLQDATHSAAKSDAGFAPPSETAGLYLAPGNAAKERAGELGVLAQRGNLSQVPPLASKFVRGNIADEAMPGGELNLKAFPGATDKYAETARGMPSLKPDLERISGQAAKANEIGDSALSNLFGTEPKKGIASVLSSPDPIAALTDVRTRLAGNPKALDSLKRNFVDHYIDRLTNTNKASANGELPPSYSKLVNESEKKNLAGYMQAAGFTPKEIQAFENAKTHGIEPLSKLSVQGAPGSPTVEKATMLGKLVGLTAKTTMGYWPGTTAESAVFRVLDALTQRGQQSVNTASQKAALSPEVMMDLLRRNVQPQPDIGRTPIVRLLAAQQTNNDEKRK